MSLHYPIVKILRQLADDNPLYGIFQTLDDEAIIRQMFANYRGRENSNARGMRLTSTGLQFMKAAFKSCEIKCPDNTVLQARHLIYLDRASQLPYHYDGKYITCFDYRLAMQLRLAEGDINTLIGMDFS